MHIKPIVYLTSVCLFLVFLSFIASCVQSAELIAHWPFNEGEGNTVHDHAGDNQGTIHGAEWSDGLRGSALKFDGKESYVRIPHSDVFNLTELTLSAWIYPTAYPEGAPVFWAGIVGKNYQTESVYGLRLSDAEKLSFRVYGLFGEQGRMSHFTYHSDTTLNLNEWYHVVVAYDGTHVRYYINGKIDSAYEETREPAFNESDIYIGSTHHRFRFFSGMIDDVKIYNGALSHSSILKEYESNKQ